MLFLWQTGQARHHLIFGRSLRALADEDNQAIETCNMCHNLAIKPEDRVHGNPKAEKLSKALGQALWERDYIELNQCSGDLARQAFMERYGRNYL